MPLLVANNLTKVELERAKSGDDFEIPAEGKAGFEMVGSTVTSPLGRDLGEARKAFSKKDIDALIASHDKAVGAPEDHAGDAGENRRWKERGCFDMSCSDKEYFCVLKYDAKLLK
jgi:hypothetical protein